MEYSQLLTHHIRLIYENFLAVITLACAPLPLPSESLAIAIDDCI